MKNLLKAYLIVLVLALSISGFFALFVFLSELGLKLVDIFNALPENIQTIISIGAFVFTVWTIVAIWVKRNIVDEPDKYPPSDML